MTPVIAALILSAIVAAVIAIFWATDRIRDGEALALGVAWVFATLFVLRVAGL